MPDGPSKISSRGRGPDRVFTGRADVFWKTLVAGLVLLAVAGYFFHSNVTFSKHGVVATAEVLDAGGPHERPTARFVTRAGREIVTKISTDGGDLRAGESLTVEYDERDPTRAREIDRPWNWGLPIGLTMVGLAMPAVAGWIFLRRLREYPGWDALPPSEIAEIFGALSVPWWPAAPSPATADGSREHEEGRVLMLRQDQQAIHRALPGWDLRAVGAGSDQGRWRAGQRLSTAVEEVWCRRGRGEPWRVRVSLLEQPPPPAT